MALLEDVGRRIAEVRVERGWTQEECAVQLEVTVRRLRRFEAGANLTLATLERIAIALRVTPRSLLDPPGDAKRPGPGRPRKAKPPASPQPKVPAAVDRAKPKRAAARRTTKKE